MSFAAPKDLSRFEVLFDHSEINANFPNKLREFTGNVGFPKAPASRPWVYSNFVQSVDGLVTFGGNRPGGEWISRSRHDRWMMDLLRAHADAVICGSRSLELEARFGRISGGPVYRIVDPDLLDYRANILHRKKQINIIVSGSGSLRAAEYRLFHSEHVEGWIVATPAGAQKLKETSASETRVLVSGQGDQIDWHDLLSQLHQLGISYLLCEGGPGLYGSMMRARTIDEKFLTISPQEIGAEPPADAAGSSGEHNDKSRITSFTGPGFSPESAQWYRLMSGRRAGDHLFLRYRAASRGSDSNIQSP
jgi:riboflavin biosynthesis pyrimidine reductase